MGQQLTEFDGKYEFRWVTPGKIVRTFARAGIGENVIRDTIARQIATVRKHLPVLLYEANATHPAAIYHDIAQGILTRLRQIERN